MAAVEVMEAVPVPAGAVSTAVVPAEFETVNDVLEYLEDVTANTSTRARIHRAADLILQHAQAVGLRPSELERLAGIVCSDNLYAMTTRGLVRAMIPQTTVTEQTALGIVSKISTQKLNLKLQQQLLQWLLVVFDHLGSRKRLHALYGMLFAWLGYETLRPQLCHLLYLLTRRQDVAPYRVRRLLALQRSVGPEPALVALLSCYKLYCPHMLSLVVTGSRKRWFPILDRKLSAHVQAVQAAHRNGTAATTTTTMTTASTKTAAATTLRLVGGRATSTAGVPAVVTRAAEHSTAPTLEAMDSFEQVALNLDSLALPQQLAAVLEDRRLQHVLSCLPQRAAVRRLGYWLSVRLVDSAVHTGNESPAFAALLRALGDFGGFMDETIPVFDSFLTPYLRRWNGVDYRADILRLIALMPPQPFESLYTNVLKPLARLLTTSTADTQHAVLRCFTEVTRRYATYDWHAHYAAAATAAEGGESAPPTPVEVLGAPIQPADYMRTLRELMAFVGDSYGVCLQQRPDDLLLQDECLSFYELTSSLCRQGDLPLVCVPAPVAVYQSVLSNTGMALSRMCGILTECSLEYKHFVGNSETYARGLLPHKPAVENIEHFNAYIMDVVNMIWRNGTLRPGSTEQTLLFDARNAARRAAANGEEEANAADTRTDFGAAVREALAGTDVVDDSVPELLSMTQNWACAGLSRCFLEHKVKEGDSSSSSSSSSSSTAVLKPSHIQKKWRRGLVDFLANKGGMFGLQNFLYTFISSLKSKPMRRT